MDCVYGWCTKGLLSRSPLTLISIVSLWGRYELYASGEVGGGGDEDAVVGEDEGVLALRLGVYRFLKGTER